MKKYNVKSYFATIVAVFATSGLIIPEADANEGILNKTEHSSIYLVSESCKCGVDKETHQ